MVVMTLISVTEYWFFSLQRIGKLYVVHRRTYLAVSIVWLVTKLLSGTMSLVIMVAITIIIIVVVVTLTVMVALVIESETNAHYMEDFVRM
jgi:hypothetical protein